MPPRKTRLTADRVACFLPDALFLLSLLLSGYLFVRHGASAVDIDPNDESYYLLSSLGLFSRSADWSPLYVKFLSLYAYLIPGVEEVYYRNVMALSIALPLALYFLARRLATPPITAALAAFFFLISFANLPLSPKTHHFDALCVCLLFGWLSFLRPAQASRFSWFAFAALASLPLYYVRPERQISVALYTLLTLVFFSRTDGWKKLGGFLCAGLALGTLLVALFGPPDSGRQFGVFRDQVVFVYKINADPADPRLRLPDDEIFRELYGETDSVARAIWSRPENYLRHLGHSLRQFFWRGGQLLFLHFPIFSSGEGRGTYLEGISWWLLILLSGLWRPAPSAAITQRKFNWMAGALALAVLPAALACLLFFTLPRYLVILPVALLALAAHLPSRFRAAPAGPRAYGGASFLLAIAFPLLLPQKLFVPSFSEPIVYGPIARAAAPMMRAERGSCLISPLFYSVHFPCEADLGYDYRMITQGDQFLRYLEIRRPLYVVVVERSPLELLEGNELGTLGYQRIELPTGVGHYLFRRHSPIPAENR